MSDRLSALARSARRPWRHAIGGALVATFLLAGPAAAKSAPESFSPLVKELLPTVVNVSTTQTVQARQNMPQFEMPDLPEGSPFRDFFERFFGEQGQMPNAPPRRATALGSGFIVDAQGHVVTNNHVIQGAEEIEVILHDGRRLKAELVGRDEKTDIAVLKVDNGASLPYASWGDSDRSEVGDWVVAIGNPFGLGGTVTAGIISARSRDINAGPYDDFIQTDASINRGNSGGPMFNTDGEVIGVNAAIYSPSGGNIGIGFAIPSSLARPVVRQLIESGSVERGWLGVAIQSVNPEIAESLGLASQQGALVANVNPGGPADEAGIKQGDVILSFGGTSIDEMRRLPRVVADTQIGKRVRVDLWRNGKRQEVTVKVGRLDDEVVAAATPGAETAPATPGNIPELGLGLAAVDGMARQQFELPADLSGVVVTQVDPAGPAAEKQIRVGDVITEVNKHAVGSVADVKRQVSEWKEQGRNAVLLRVVRGGNPIYVAVKIGKGVG